LDARVTVKEGFWTHGERSRRDSGRTGNGQGGILDARGTVKEGFWTHGERSRRDSGRTGNGQGGILDARGTVKEGFYLSKKGKASPDSLRRVGESQVGRTLEFVEMKVMLDNKKKETKCRLLA
jgi:hypothetical protein